MFYYEQIGWVDEYVTSVAPFIYVREEDNVLIKIPNEVYKLNKYGIKILKYLLRGESVYSIVNRYEDKEKISQDLHVFFCDLRAMLKGCFHACDKRKAVEETAFTLPFNTLPVLSEIAITYRCNLSCQFCYASCGCMKKESAKELSTESLKDILGIIKEEAFVPSVSFTGGEPTLREDLPELIRHAKSLEMWTNLITNGTRIDFSYAKELKEAGLDSSQVSLEAGEFLLHDEIVQKQGAFQQTIHGVDCLRKAGIRVHTNTTISRLNKDYLFSILDYVKKNNLEKFSMNMLMPEGSALKHLENILVTYSEIGAIVLDVQKYAKELNLEFMWYSPTPMCVFNPILHGLGNKGCAACDGLLSIAPNGDILPCSSYPQSMGNIIDMQGDFQRRWQGPAFKYFQEKKFAHEKCQACEDLAICNGGCPLYWRQVGFQELLSQQQEVVV